MKKLLAGLMGAAAVTAAVALAPTASADRVSESEFIVAVDAAGLEATSGHGVGDLVAAGYQVCDILGNHSGGYVASQIWTANDGRITWTQANSIVYAAIAHLCPWRWY